MEAPNGYNHTLVPHIIVRIMNKSSRHSVWHRSTKRNDRLNPVTG